MKRISEICKKAFHLRVYIALPLMIAAFTLLIIGMNMPFPQPLLYPVYILSAYALTVGVYFVIYDLPRLFRYIRKKVCSLPYVGEFIADNIFMAKFSIYQGLFMNTAFALFKIISAAVYRSIWLFSVGVYYILLGAVRLILVKGMRAKTQGNRLLHEFRCYRLCAVEMLVLNAALVGILVQMINHGRTYSYPLFITYVSAIFSFYCLITAIINMVKFRRTHSPIIAASKTLTFMGALVSMINLTAAMLSQFGGGANFRIAMLSGVGGSVSLAIVIMSVYMIIRGSIQIKRIEKNAEKG